MRKIKAALKIAFKARPSEIFADEPAETKSPQMQLKTCFEDDFGSITMAAEIAAGRSQNEVLEVASNIKNQNAK